MPRSPSVHVPFPRLTESADLLSERGLDVEVMFSAPVLDSLSDSELDNAFARLRHRPRVTLHAPFMDLSPGAVDPLIRKITLKRFRQMTRIAGQVGAATIVFHSGYEKWKYHLHPEIWLQRSAETWRHVLAEVENSETCIAIENIFEDSPDNLVNLARQMNHPRFGLCFDTGHFNLFSNVELESWLEETSDHILHLHVHDNDGTADRHLPPGRGTFPFARFFQWFGTALPPFTLEAHNQEMMLEGLNTLVPFLQPGG